MGTLGIETLGIDLEPFRTAQPRAIRRLNYSELITSQREGARVSETGLCWFVG